MTSGGQIFVTGSKTFEITDYSIVKGIGNKNGIQSERFTVGGYDWVVEFYPQGIDERFLEHVSVFVRVLNAPKEVKAMYTFRLRDWTTSKWSTTMPASSDLLTFSPSGNTQSWGYQTYIKKSVLETSNFLKDDTLIIKCTLWVTPPPPIAPTPTPPPPAVFPEGKPSVNEWNPSGADISIDNRAVKTDDKPNVNKWNTSGANISFDNGALKTDDKPTVNEWNPSGADISFDNGALAPGPATRTSG